MAVKSKWNLKISFYHSINFKVHVIWKKNSVINENSDWYSFLFIIPITQGSWVANVVDKRQDLIVNSPLWLLHIFLQSSYKNLVLDQDKNFYLISLNVLITCLLDNIWIL